MAEGPALTRDEALLWLNDRLGRQVYVTLEVGGVSVLAMAGTLRHEVAEGLATGEHVDPANVGWYSIGDYGEDEEGTHLDLTDLGDVTAYVFGDSVLKVGLSRNVALRIEVASV